jgi:hypothetical protein
MSPGSFTHNAPRRSTPMDRRGACVQRVDAQSPAPCVRERGKQEPPQAHPNSRRGPRFDGILVPILDHKSAVKGRMFPILCGSVRHEHDDSILASKVPPSEAPNACWFGECLGGASGTGIHVQSVGAPILRTRPASSRTRAGRLPLADPTPRAFGTPGAIREAPTWATGGVGPLGQDPAHPSGRLGRPVCRHQHRSRDRPSLPGVASKVPWMTSCARTLSLRFRRWE